MSVPSYYSEPPSHGVFRAIVSALQIVISVILLCIVFVWLFTGDNAENFWNAFFDFANQEWANDLPLLIWNF